MLIWDENGDLHDQDGHLYNAACQRLDDHRAIIPDPEADNQQAADVENAAANAQAVAEENVQVSIPRSLAEFNCPD